jgi:hypothetical protein
MGSFPDVEDELRIDLNLRSLKQGKFSRLNVIIIRPRRFESAVH